MNSTNLALFTKTNPNIRTLQDKLGGKLLDLFYSVGSSDKLYQGKYCYSLNVSSRVLDSWQLRKPWNAWARNLGDIHEYNTRLKVLVDNTTNFSPKGSVKVSHHWRGVTFHTNNLEYLMSITDDLINVVFKDSDPARFEFFLRYEACWPGQTARQRYCKELPHKAYKYRIDFKSNAIFEVEEKRQFVEWIDAYGDEFKMTPQLRNFFATSNFKRNYSTKYFYAKSDNLLSLITLYHADKISNVDEFVTAKELLIQYKKEMSNA